jgi:hypothetical protein
MINIDRELRENANLPLAVNMGMVPYMSAVDKFGENPDIDTGGIAEDIWEGGGLYTWSETSDIDTVSVSDVSDVGQQVLIVGICSPQDVSETIGYAVTNGQNKVLIYDNPGLTGDPISFWRVYRVSNESDAGGAFTGMLYVYVDTAIVGGVPTDATTVRAIINDGNNQTLMAVYTVPPGKVGFLYRGEMGLSRAQSAGSAQGAYYSRRYGKIFKIKKRVDISNAGSSIYQDRRSFPDIIPALTDIKLTIEEVSSNNTGVFGTFDILLVDEDKFSAGYLAAIGQPDLT